MCVYVGPLDNGRLDDQVKGENRCWVMQRGRTVAGGNPDSAIDEY